MSKPLEQLEVESNRLMLFAREQNNNTEQFSSLVRHLAKLGTEQPQSVKDALLELVRLAKLYCFQGGCAFSLVAVAHDKLQKEIRAARLAAGEQLVSPRPEEAKVKTWSKVHASPHFNVPSNWEDLQQSGVLYGDHHHEPTVVLSTDSSGRKASTGAAAPQHYNNKPPQPVVAKPNPERDKALLEIETLFGEEAKVIVSPCIFCIKN